MRFDFTEQDLQDEVNKIELEGEDVMLIGQYIESVENEDNVYIITGNAVIEGETYHDFVTMFATVYSFANPSARVLAEAEWDWFDYICD